MQKNRTEGEREEGRRDLLGLREGEKEGGGRSYHIPASCWRQILQDHRATHGACFPLLEDSKKLRLQGQNQRLWNPGPSTHGLNE